METNEFHPSNRLARLWAQDSDFRRQARKEHGLEPTIQKSLPERQELQRYFRLVDNALIEYEKKVRTLINESSWQGNWFSDIKQDILKYQDRANEYKAGDLSLADLRESSSIAIVSQLIFKDPAKLAELDLFKSTARQLRISADQTFTRKDLVALFVKLKQDELKSIN